MIFDVFIAKQNSTSRSAVLARLVEQLLLTLNNLVISNYKNLYLILPNTKSPKYVAKSGHTVAYPKVRFPTFLK